MSYSNPENIRVRKCSFHLVPVNEEPNEEHQMEPNISSTLEVSQKMPGTNDKSCPKHSCNTTILPFPTSLPPVNKKTKVYLRLQKYAYSEINNIPKTSPEAKLHCKSERQEEINRVEVITSAKEGMLAGWSRIAARASQFRSVSSCSIPASVETLLLQAFVRLQFHAGQTWVPDTPKRMILLFLSLTCTFSSPDLENNMLCPELIAMGKEKQPDLITQTSFPFDRSYLNRE
ncbi:unnamed protein product [Nyctereutes procyonoides]|uniref:(raccoon dog) hypothetical protein n=1 Tax=Nyctereutes procyonoides TaxID=34880 RepID=A0A811XQ59_NYCPR|nr:unnamed protein product [Nyctereutes procyonoides]